MIIKTEALNIKGPIRIWVLSLFPEFIKQFLDLGVVGKGLRGERGNGIELNAVNIRDYAHNRYKNVDSPPFGGGPGMIMRADVLQRALEEGVFSHYEFSKGKWKDHLLIVCTSPRGQRWNQQVAKSLADSWGSKMSSKRDLVIICGRYEGIDERFIEHYIEQEWSIGDFILSGGELAALTMLDSLLRLLPGVLGNRQALDTESFEGGLLEAPQYTRPREFEGREVPEVLLSGHHQKIEEYNLRQRIEITKKFRPDLIIEEE